jgi:hypothetical protein
MSDTPDDAEGLDPATVDAEAEEARSGHGADRPPTEEEEQRADAQTANPSVGEHFDEMNKIGADVKGEGEIS